MSTSTVVINTQRNKRVRRDTRRGSNNEGLGYSRAETVAILYDMKALKAKNPTRLIPDIPGFFCLTKNEIKQDSKDIHKISLSSMLIPSDEKKGAASLKNFIPGNMIKRSLRPKCEPESTLFAKKNRLLQWLSLPDPAAAGNRELQIWRGKASASQIQFERQQFEEDLWRETFQFSRSSLLDAIRSSAESNLVLKTETQRLFNLIEEQQPQASRKRRVRQMKDVLSELHERQVLLEERIQEYEDLIMEYSEEQKNEKGRKKARHEKLLPPLVQEAPIIVVEVEPAPLECIQRPFHWQAYARKSDDFLLKMFPGKVSDPIDVQVSKESNGVVHTAKPVPSPMSAQPVSSSTTPLPNNNGKARVHDLPTVFTSIEEHVRVTQFTQGDVDAVFSDSRTDWEKPLLQSILARCPNDDEDDDSEQHGASALNALWLTLNSQGDAAKPFLSLDRVPNGWGRYMNTFFDNMQPQETIVTRRKKRDLENAIPLPATADIKVRPPRGVPLLFSPLSQYEDRMLGTLTTETIFKPMEQRDNDLAKDNRLVVSYSYDKVFQLPSEVLSEEDAVLERCQLQSCAAIAELKLRRLYSNSADVTKGLQDGELALARRRAAYLHALGEDAAERQRIDSELSEYGLLNKNLASTKTRSSIRSRGSINGANVQHSEVNLHMSNCKVPAATSSNGSSRRNNDRSSRPQAHAAKPSPNRMGPPEAAVTRSSQSRGTAHLVKEEPVNSRSSSRSRDRVALKSEVEAGSEEETFSMLNGGQVSAMAKVTLHSGSSNRNRVPSQAYSAIDFTSGTIDDGVNGVLPFMGSSTTAQMKRKSISK